MANNLYQVSGEADGWGKINNIANQSLISGGEVVLNSDNSSANTVTIIPKGVVGTPPWMTASEFNNYAITFTPNAAVCIAGSSTIPTTINFVNANNITATQINTLLSNANFDPTQVSSSDIPALISDISIAISNFPQSQMALPNWGNGQSLISATSSYFVAQIGQVLAAPTITYTQTIGIPGTVPSETTSEELSNLRSNQRILGAFFPSSYAGTPAAGSDISIAQQDFIDGENNPDSVVAQFQSLFTTSFNAIAPNGPNVTAPTNPLSPVAMAQSSGTNAAAGLGLDPNMTANSTVGVVYTGTASGTNSFPPHQPWDQIMSILDVMRNESLTMTSTKPRVVQNNSTPSTATGNNQSACQSILSLFKPSDIINMINVLEQRILSNNKQLTTLVFNITRMQSNPKFLYLGSLLGFGGISTSSLSNPSNINFDELNVAIQSVQNAISKITTSQVASLYGQLIASHTGIISPLELEALISAAVNMNKVNFGAVTSTVPPSTLQSCTSVGAIQNAMQDPGQANSKVVGSLQTSLAQQLKLYSSQVFNLQTAVNQNKNYAKYITTLKSVV